MIASSLSFLLGHLLLFVFPDLPEINTMIVLSIILMAISIILMCYGHVRFYLIIVMVLGLIMSYWQAKNYFSEIFPTQLEGKPLLVQGMVASLPIINSQNKYQNFLFETKNCFFKDKKFSLQTKIKLSTNDKINFKIGDEYECTMKLKNIRSTFNDHLFNYEKWAFAKGVTARAYVINNNCQFRSHAWYFLPFEQLRQSIQEKISKILFHSNSLQWVLALAIGDQSNITSKNWDVLKKTGANHLFAIAGLHIGMLSELAYLFFSFIWRWLPRFSLYLPAQMAAAAFSCLIACYYSLIAGFSLPAERACLMMIVFTFTILSKQKIYLVHVVALALFVVLFIDPLCILTDSFWLSFGTIGIIMYGVLGRLNQANFFMKWFRIQLMLTIGVVPFTLYLYGDYSMMSLLANSIAIPIMEWLILPVNFLAGLFLFAIPKVSEILFYVSSFMLTKLYDFLFYLSQIKQVNLFPIPSFFIFISTLMGFLIFMMPKGLPGRFLGIFWFLPFITYQPVVPDQGDFFLKLFDVGQGLSALIQTKHHVLLYDAGPKYQQFDSGAQIIVPLLRYDHINRLDMMVISHSDNDHMGGAESVMNNTEISLIKTSVPNKIHFKNISYCLAGKHWEWDGVRFSFLYPDRNHLNFNNNSSCVLKVENNYHQLLLSGDIEKLAENNLLKSISDQLHATVLIAPHHGSKTSSQMNFIRRVHPSVVLYATAYKNRYHLPNQVVVNRYRDLHVQQINTADSGSIWIDFKNYPELLHPVLARDKSNYFWNQR